jgi:hypothetical protein
LLLIYCLPFLDLRFLVRDGVEAPLMPQWMEGGTPCTHVGELGAVRCCAGNRLRHGILDARPTLRLPWEQKNATVAWDWDAPTILGHPDGIAWRHFRADLFGHVRFELAVNTPPLRTRVEVEEWIERLSAEFFAIPPAKKDRLIALDHIPDFLADAYQVHSLKTAPCHAGPDRERMRGLSPRLFHTARGAPFYVLLDQEGVCDMAVDGDGAGLETPPYAVTTFNEGVDFFWHVRGADATGENGSDLCAVTSYFLEVFTLPDAVSALPSDVLNQANLACPKMSEPQANNWLRTRHSLIHRARVGPWPATRLFSVLGQSLRHTEILETGSDYSDIFARIPFPIPERRGFFGNFNQFLPKEHQIVVTVNNTFNIENFHGVLNNTVNAVEGSAAADGVKDTMRALKTLLADAVAAKAIDPAVVPGVQRQFESLGNELTETPPDAHTVRTCGERIKAALATAADYAEPVAKIVGAIIAQVAP